MSYITDNFHKWKIQKLGTYENGRIAIGFYNPEDGEPECTATVNIPEEHLEEGEVILKSYSENAGLYECMLKAGMVSEAIRSVQTGWVSCPVVRLLITV